VLGTIVVTAFHLTFTLCRERRTRNGNVHVCLSLFPYGR